MKHPAPPRRPAPRTRIKICGLTREEDLDAAVAAGVDAIGLVLYAASPRAVTLARAPTPARRPPPLLPPPPLFLRPRPPRRAPGAGRSAGPAPAPVRDPGAAVRQRAGDRCAGGLRGDPGRNHTVPWR